MKSIADFTNSLRFWYKYAIILERAKAKNAKVKLEKFIGGTVVMRKKLLCLIPCLLLSSPAWALFCVKCGMKVPDEAKFCNECGTKVVAPKAATKAGDKSEEKSANKILAKKAPVKPITLAKGSTYRVKADLFLYERRGDEHNVLKKNLFFKPRRYKLSRDTEFKILEVVADSYLVQSIPVKDGLPLRGWVTFEELSLRSDFKK
ncbi:MAG: zinc ribbon domain-containing protein [Candidatus Ozemobacteraceae bacterium]